MIWQRKYKCGHYGCFCHSNLTKSGLTAPSFCFLDFHRLELDSSSPLYTKLCGADGNGDCTLPAKVVLMDNLFYDAVAQSGAEHAVDTIRTVKFKVGSTTIWYEHIKQPCVEHAFYR